MRGHGVVTGPVGKPTNVRWGIFALACGTSLLLYLHRYTWNLVGPELKADYGLSNTEAGLLFSLFYYTYAGGQIPSGVVIDRVGPRRVLTASILAWSVSLAALAWTSALWGLGALRLVFGLGQAACYPSLTKASRSWFPASRRTAMQGWVATTSGRSGAALSPIILGTVLMGGMGMEWRSALLLLAAVGLVWGVVFGLLFRDSPGRDPRVNAEERELIGGDGAPAEGERKTLDPKKAVRSRSLWFFAMQQFLDAGSDVAFVSLIGGYFLQARGIEIGKTGLLASLPLWGGALGGIAGGWLNDRLIEGTGSRRWSRSAVGAAGKVVGCLALLMVPGQAGALGAGICLMVAKFFSDWSQPTTWGMCTDLGGRFSATVFSVINTAGTLGGVAMPLVYGWMLDAFTTKGGEGIPDTTDWGPLFLLLSGMYLGSGLCWLLVDCTKRLDTGEAPR